MTPREKTQAISRAEYRRVNIARWSVSHHDTYESAYTYYQPTPVPFASACELSINILLNGLDLLFNNGRIPIGCIHVDSRTIIHAVQSVSHKKVLSWEQIGDCHFTSDVGTRPQRCHRKLTVSLMEDTTIDHLTMGQEIFSSFSLAIRFQNPLFGSRFSLMCLYLWSSVYRLKWFNRCDAIIFLV